MPADATEKPARAAQPLGRVLVVHNPRSGRGLGVAAADESENALRARGVEVRRLAIDQLEREGCDDSFDAAAVFGGDGTIRGAVDALLSRGCVVPPLLAVAVGTANLLAKHIQARYPSKALGELVADSLARGARRPIDVARANGRPFLLHCSVGFDADVVHRLAAARTGPITKLSYVPPFLGSLRDLKQPPHLIVDADGARVFGPAPGYLMVANAPEYGVGFTLTPDARSDDGLLDACVIPVGSRLGLLRSFAEAAVGLHKRRVGVVIAKAKRVDVRVEGDGHVPAQFDGDPAGTTPLTIEVSDVQLQLIMPSVPSPGTPGEG